jgi:membrane fusion protein (multidrug efflux system)
VSLDAAEYRAQLEESTASLRLQELNFERAKKLFEQKLSSRQDYDQDAAQFAEAQARRALDEERLRKTELRAPFGGTVGLRRVSPGAFVQPGQDIVELQDLSAMKVDFQVPELYLPDVTAGLALSVSIDTFPGEIFSGQVYAIAPSLDINSRSVQVRARVDNPEGKLRPGLFARVNLLIAQRDAAVMIPEEALWPIGKEQFVYRVIDGKAVLTRIVSGYRRSGEVEISSGLQDGEQVITAGQMKIRDGAPVMVINQSSAAE